MSLHWKKIKEFLEFFYQTFLILERTYADKRFFVPFKKKSSVQWFTVEISLHCKKITEFLDLFPKSFWFWQGIFCAIL